MIQFRAKYLSALLPFIGGPGEIRHYLRYLRAEPHPDGGAVLVATNGHMLMCIRDSSATCSEAVTFAVSRDALKHCKERKASLDPLVRINPITARLTVFGGPNGDEVFVQPGKCLCPDPSSFPDWRRVIPAFAKLQPAVADNVQAKYLMSAASAHPGLQHRHGNTGTRLWQAAAQGVVVVEYDGFPEYLLAIMPLRDKGAVPTVQALWTAAFNAKHIEQIGSDKKAA